MNKRAALKVLAFVFCVIIVASTVLTAVLESTHVMHHCMKDQCVICAVITARKLLRTNMHMAVQPLTALATLLIGFGYALRAVRRQKVATLITKKVRLNP